MAEKEQEFDLRKGRGEEKEKEEAKQKEERGDDQNFLPSQERCIHCAIATCLCDLLKVEMKIKILRKTRTEGEEERKEVAQEDKDLRKRKRKLEEDSVVKSLEKFAGRA